MKRIELRKVPCGETFTVFNEEYVVLDHVDGGVLSIRKEIWKKAVFDRSGNSNLSEADILQVLSEYGELLKTRGAKAGDLHSQRVDLKATDGTRVYGYLDCTVALLTLEQYGKYKEIIPKADDWWWLATPVWTRWLRSPYTGNTSGVWGVRSGGGYSYWGASNSCGVRPVLTFDSCLLVSIDLEEGEECDCCGESDNYHIDLSRVDTLTLVREVERRLNKAVSIVFGMEESCDEPGT